MKNRKLNKFEIWLRNYPKICIMYDVAITLLLFICVGCIINAAIESESVREDAQIQYWKSMGYVARQ